MLYSHNLLPLVNVMFKKTQHIASVYLLHKWKFYIKTFNGDNEIKIVNDLIEKF